MLVTDREPADKLAASVAQLDGLPIEFVLGEHRKSDFTDADLIVVSPAIPPTNEFVIAAREARVPITTEICLFVERCPTAMTVGVTGTKGKSTTTALLGRMLRAATPAGRHLAWRSDPGRQQREPHKHPAPAIVGPLDAPRQIFVGGNIGTSLLDRLPDITPSDIVVLELSSFMLHHLGAIRWSPHVALVTMIGTDHVEWHGDAERYLADKQNLVRSQTERDFAVVSSDSPGSRAFGKLTKGRVIEYGKRAEPAGRVRAARARQAQPIERARRVRPPPNSSASTPTRPPPRSPISMACRTGSSSCTRPTACAGLTTRSPRFPRPPSPRTRRSRRTA